MVLSHGGSSLFRTDDQSRHTQTHKHIHTYTHTHQKTTDGGGPNGSAPHNSHAARSPPFMASLPRNPPGLPLLPPPPAESSAPVEFLTRATVMESWASQTSVLVCGGRGGDGTGRGGDGEGREDAGRPAEGEHGRQMARAAPTPPLRLVNRSGSPAHRLSRRPPSLGTTSPKGSAEVVRKWTAVPSGFFIWRLKARVELL